MARPPSTHPTDGELELLQVLWQAGPCSLGQICTALRRRRPIATTTVATMLKVMLDKTARPPQTHAAGLSLVGQDYPPNRRRRAWSANWSIWSSTARPNASSHTCLESDQLSDQERKELRRLIDTEPKPRDK